MINSLFIKRFVLLLLLLIYGCRLAQQSSVIMYFKERAWVTTAPIRCAAEVLSKRSYADNDRTVRFNFPHFSCLKAFDFARPKSFINHKFSAFLCKHCALWC